MEFASAAQRARAARRPPEHTDGEGPGFAASHVLALQASAGNHAVASLLRDAAPGAPPVEAGQGAPPGAAPPKQKASEFPPWAITSSTEPLPGDPIPGYEEPRDAYTERDIDAFEAALLERERTNKENVGEFLGDYSEALVELWGKYATEAMAEASDSAGWDALFGAFLFVVKESLIIASGTWAAARFASHVAQHVVEFLTAATLETAKSAVKGAVGSAEVQAKREELDAMTEALARDIKKLDKGVIAQIGDVAPYAKWLRVQSKSAPDAGLTELSKFRIPPLFPPTPRDVVRSAVAQSVIGQLHGPGAVFATRKEPALWGIFGYYNVPKDNVITVYAGGTIGAGPASFTQPSLKTSQVLANEIRGRTIGELPNIPLHVSLSCGDPVAGVQEMLAGTSLLYDPKAEAEAKDPYALRVRRDLRDPTVIEAFVEAYPSKAPAAVTRDSSGHVLVRDGGLLEHLYLYGRVNAGRGLATILGELEDRRLARELEEAESLFGTGQSEMASPQELAREVWLEVMSDAELGAEDFVLQEVNSLSLTNV